MRTLKKNLVSIIVNCHNGEKFIARCIKSIIDQTYQNFEIIFCDNQSTDKTSLILNSINDIRLKYFQTKKFIKLYEARNFAIDKAEGEYIAFLDIDDTWEKNKLQSQLDYIKKNNSDICFTNYWVSKNKIKYLFKKNLKIDNIQNRILNDYPIGILTVIIKSNIFFKENYFFNKNYEIIGDFDFFFRLSRKFKFSCLDKPLSTYYIHNENLSIKKLDVEINEFDKWIIENKETLNNNKNTLIQKNNIRYCNYLYNQNKLFLNSKELKKIEDNKIKLKFYTKIILKRLNLIR